MHEEIQAIFSGKKSVRFEDPLRAVINFLERGKRANNPSAHWKQVKDQEAKSLIAFADSLGLWPKIDFNNYISEGAEQKVYLKDGFLVEKLNDAIYFETWLDYFKNLMLHNHFFPDTAYELKGFCSDNGILYAVVQQAFVKADKPTDLTRVKEFLEFNGFRNTRHHDYFNPELGIILEDLHDENVLTQKDNLFFIDTVFYLVE